MRADGQVWAFNTGRPDMHPFLIQGLSHIVAIAAGIDEALFLDDTGHVWSRQVFQNSNSVNPGVPMPVAALDHTVAIGPGFFALKTDGSVIHWDDTVTPPVVQLIQGLGAVTDVGFDFALTADGAFVDTVRDGDAIVDNSYTAASAISFSTPINQTQYAHFDASIALRSDGTAWDASVYYENSDPFPLRTPRQLDTPPHVVGVGTSGYSMAILTADGSVYQAPLPLGFLQSSGANTAFIKIPALDSVLLPPSDAPQPDFDVSGPALSTTIPGASIDVPLTVSRSGGFTGDITVTGQNPPAGLTVAPLTIPASATRDLAHHGGPDADAVLPARAPAGLDERKHVAHRADPALDADHGRHVASDLYHRGNARPRGQDRLSWQLEVRTSASGSVTIRAVSSPSET